MDTTAFERLVAETLDSLPDDLRRLLDNVEVTVTLWPSAAVLKAAGLGPGQTLFGLYQGVPQTRRGSHYGMVPPDKITIFQGPIERVYRTPAAIRAQVRKTVLHELAHHFGISEERLREIGTV
jgi:predicted Zn-dependent protease with MMP-like domain